MIHVEVAYANPQRQLILALQVPPGCTLEQAIERSGIREKFPDMKVEAGAVGIFSRKAPLDQVLHEGDRVEIYRPLLADPKESRRRRAAAGEKEA